MKMKKLLKTVMLISIVVLLLSTSSYAITRQEFLYDHEDKIVKICEEYEVRLSAQRSSGLAEFFALPSHYECAITSFFGLHNVLRLMTTIDRNSEDWIVFQDLMIANYIEEHDTWDFIVVHIDFEKYLEEKKINE